MEFQRRARARLASRHVKLVLCIVAVLALCRGIVLADESVPIVGDHLNYVPFTTELADSQPLQLEVIMALNRRGQLAQLEDDLQNRDSPSYHRWLTPQQFARNFGPTTQQMQAVANWLSSRGVMVSTMDPLGRTVRFAGLYVSQGKASVTRRESQAAVGCSLTAVNTIFLRSRARMIVT